MSYSFNHPKELSKDKVQFIERFYETSDTRDVEGVEFSVAFTPLNPFSLLTPSVS